MRFVLVAAQPAQGQLVVAPSEFNPGLVFCAHTTHVVRLKFWAGDGPGGAMAALGNAPPLEALPACPDRVTVALPTGAAVSLGQIFEPLLGQIQRDVTVTLPDDRSLGSAEQKSNARDGEAQKNRGHDDLEKEGTSILPAEDQFARYLQ